MEAKAQNNFSCHYGEKLVVLGTQFNSPEVLINSNNPELKVISKSNQEFLICHSVSEKRCDILLCNVATVKLATNTRGNLFEKHLPPPPVTLF